MLDCVLHPDSGHRPCQGEERNRSGIKIPDYNIGRPDGTWRTAP